MDIGVFCPETIQLVVKHHPSYLIMVTEMMQPSSTTMCSRSGIDVLLLLPGMPVSSQPMTSTQRRQPSVVPLTLSSDLPLQQSPQQLSPTLSSPGNLSQVTCIVEGGRATNAIKAE